MIGVQIQEIGASHLNVISSSEKMFPFDRFYTRTPFYAKTKMYYFIINSMIQITCNL